MNIEKKKLVFEDIYPLEKFTNEEIYYIISSLLGLGDPGFVPERLYLSFNERSSGEVPCIKFLLLTITLIDEQEWTEYHLGKIDSEFDEIEIYSGRCSPSELTPEHETVDTTLIVSNLQERTYPNEFRPITFLRGIGRIVSPPDFNKRKNNDLFSFYWDSPCPRGIKYSFDLGKIGPFNTSFSGNYYLIARPEEKEFSNTIISSFKVHDNYDRKIYTDYVQFRIDVKESVVGLESIQLYDQGRSENISKVEVNANKENPKAHKENIVPVLTQTVLALLNDLSQSTKENLLEDETPEELVIYCKEKYDREFDLNFDSLGIAGAHEVAWLEALSILKDDQIESN
jgi:hypothetical protein